MTDPLGVLDPIGDLIEDIEKSRKGRILIPILLYGPIIGLGVYLFFM